MTALYYEQNFCTGFTLHLAVDAGVTEGVLKLQQRVKLRNLRLQTGLLDLSLMYNTIKL